MPEIVKDLQDRLQRRELITIFSVSNSIFPNGQSLNIVKNFQSNMSRETPCFQLSKWRGKKFALLNYRIAGLFCFII